MKGTEAQLERGRTKSVAQGMQALVSSGLASTTQAAGLGKKFEEEVGAPVRLQAQDIASERLSGAERDKAGFIERREDVGPDYATIAGLTQQIGSQTQPPQSQITGTQLPKTPLSRATSSFSETAKSTSPVEVPQNVARGRPSTAGASQLRGIERGARRRNRFSN